MKTLLKSLFFAVLFLIGMTPVFADFRDLAANHLNREAVVYLENQKIVQGYPNGGFMPDTTINRAEFVKIIVASLYKSPYGTNCFSDVENEWYAKYVCFAKRKGLIKGYSDGTFKPTQNINLAEASKIIVKAFELQPQTLIAGDPWYKSYLKPLESKNVIPVSIDYVDKKLTRGEMSEIIWRLKINKTDKPAKTYENLTSEFPKLNSCAELKEKFMANAYRRDKFSYMMRMGITAEEAATPLALEAGGKGGGADYSQTNVQVEGVDEADVIKNDDKYIYLLREKTIRIIKAYPVEEMQEVFKLDLSSGDPNFWPSEMYVSGNKLTVIGNTHTTGDPTTGAEYKSKTKIYIYDITDRQTPGLARTVEFDGNYISSRKINNHLYLVMRDYPNYYRILEQESFNVESILPHFMDSKYNRRVPLVPCGEIHFYPRFTELNYLIVAGVSLDDETQSVSREVFMGSGDTVYASLNNIYVAASKYGFNEQVKYEIWNPPISNISTVLYRFNLNQGNVEYKGQGEVQGTLLNQFSMDEYNNTFRVATTTEGFWRPETVVPRTNNLYILDVNDLSKILGKIENIAPGESIYSARFIGDRAYLVTFKKIDPFFVIDVSNPSDPKILGALKIPGYSDYLHPFDENHILGFGKETIEPQEIRDINLGPGFDFAWYQGMKIALFDVTDTANPKVLFNEIIGDRGTESELLWNHKALLFDKGRNLFAFPVTVAKIKDKTVEYTGSQYGEPVFEGAYIYTLDLQNGFQLKGEVTHLEGTTDLLNLLNFDAYTLRENAKIKRIIYIGDYLYTISMGKIKAIERSTMEEKKALEIAE